MQFKTFAFLTILTILFFAGCDKKEDKEKNLTTQDNKKTNFVLNTIENKSINIEYKDNKIVINQYQDKIVLINFFATWCPPCKAEIPNLIKLQNDYPNDFKVVSILLEDGKSNEEILNFSKSFNINYDVLNGKENFELAKAIGEIKSIPTMFLIDRQSNIFQKYVGVVPFEMMEIDIKKILAK